MSTETSDSVLATTFRPLLHPPADVVVGLGVTFLVGGLLLLLSSPFQAALALPFLLFLPGYALTSAVFPHAGRRENTAPGAWYRHVRLGFGERAALSFGLSMALLPVVGLGIFLAGFTVTELTVVWSLGGVTVVGLIAGSYRRWSLPEEDRYRVPLGRWGQSFYQSLFDTDSRIDGLLNYALVYAVLAAVVMIVYAIVAPVPAASYTEFSVLTESPSGELVAAGYPSSMTQGTTESVVLSVTNEEGAARTYVAVAELQRVDQSTGAVLERSELTRARQTVADGETWQPTVELTPRLVGEDLRVMFYLYEGRAPGELSTETAEDHLFFWTDVNL